MVTDIQLQAMIKQQEQQLFYIARPEHTVLLRHHPDPEFLNYLTARGITLPQMQFIPPEDELAEVERVLKSQHFDRIIPYMMTESIQERYHLYTSVYGCDAGLTKKINDKFFVRTLAEKHGLPITRGYFCNSSEDIEQSYQKLCEAGFEKCVIKIPYGSSGKGLRVIDNREAFEKILKYITRRQPEFELLIEGWYPVKQCINCQLVIDDSGSRVIAFTEQYIDRQGVYKGTNFTPRYAPAVLEKYRYWINRAGAMLQQMNYRGICGIDSIIDMEMNIYPLIEINARFTQVTYLLPLIQDKYAHYPVVISSYITIYGCKEMSFPEFLKMMEQQIHADHTSDFLIYTFCQHRLPDRAATYRIYVLFFGTDNEQVKTMVRQFKEMEKSKGNQVGLDGIGSGIEPNTFCTTRRPSFQFPLIPID
ncbi:ATP-binding protein [Paenibacillus tyrfis]|uniref:ATP-binding protein n=1 Tax=Paenibacillus tyrfis TaxID=1501230 RepID=UPI00209D7EC4|nr:ATP-grasp domain-containing protein [Paenibacillus tyrfis]MCP1311561.1 ATP-grasp domain-containing protein [Paenibacillus tyrfis]